MSLKIQIREFQLLHYFYHLLFLLIIAGNICAQQDPREIYKNLSPEQQRAFFEQSKNYRFSREEVNETAPLMGVEPDSRHVRRMLGQEAKNNWREQVGKLPILKHIQGTSGTAVPASQAIKSSVSSPKDEAINIKEFIQKEFVPEKKKQLAERQRPLPLDHCERAETIRKEIGVVSNQSANQPELDLLFLSANDDPDDRAEVFGVKTRVLLYYPDKNLEIHQAARGLQVTCLPTRFRITKSALFVDLGTNALRNYDQDYHSAGVLHPSIH